ncbi:hypothetical protein OE766_11950 [Pararhizobium sp. YC-54]|uniref:hypothetical protein n=1 Tax=Pararhizobium sp. YC-54 TaxID=2986920 RepID=UPI0021F69EB4|nr:hypothetical protein [Pararhizobium sp. YC-54]MCV9998962.1 hypothetical protein [Pararhizobium sp. YC-54]
MIFNLLKPKCDDTADTGTYPDGAFELPVIEIQSAPRRLRGHMAHQRDYGSDRTITPIPAGFA